MLALALVLIPRIVDLLLGHIGFGQLEGQSSMPQGLGAARVGVQGGLKGPRWHTGRGVCLEGHVGVGSGWIGLGTAVPPRAPPLPRARHTCSMRPACHMPTRHAAYEPSMPTCQA